MLDCAVLDLPSIAETIGLSIEEVAGELAILEETEEEAMTDIELNLEHMMHVPIGILQEQMGEDELRRYLAAAIEDGIQKGRERVPEAG